MASFDIKRNRLGRGARRHARSFIRENIMIEDSGHGRPVVSKRGCTDYGRLDFSGHVMRCSACIERSGVDCRVLHNNHIARRGCHRNMDVFAGVGAGTLQPGKRYPLAGRPQVRVLATLRIGRREQLS